MKDPKCPSIVGTVCDKLCHSKSFGHHIDIKDYKLTPLQETDGFEIRTDEEYHIIIGLQNRQSVNVAFEIQCLWDSHSYNNTQRMLDFFAVCYLYMQQQITLSYFCN